MNAVDPIRQEVFLQALPRAVFAAFADPNRVREWFAQSATVADGTWRYEWPGGMAAEGRVLAAESPTRLVWTWEKSITTGMDGSQQTMDSRVVLSYEFSAEGTGTRFTIHESGHETIDIRDLNAAGVAQMVTSLRHYLEQGRHANWRLPPC